MFASNILLALGTIWAHKLRSFLTLSSIIIGVVCIVVMTSLASSGLSTLTRTIDSIGGSRIIFLFGYPPEKMQDKLDSYFKGLNLSDYKLLKASLPHLEQTAIYNVHRRQDIYRKGEKQRWNLGIIESDNDFLKYYNMSVAAGRPFLDHETTQRRPVCLIGHQTASNLFKKPEAAIGQEIVHGSKRLMVIGVLKKNVMYGMNFGFDWNDIVVVPIHFLSEQMEEILFKTVDSRHNQQVIDIANALLLQRHHGVDDFRFFDFSAFLDKFKQTFLIIRIVVALIAGVSLLIGGIGVMNIMLVSISERVQEIGLRKALGATPGEIAQQFLIESTVLSLLGALLGVAISIGLCLVAFAIIPRFLDQWIAVISQEAIISALTTSVLIGLGFGYFPARRAAALDPIAALRK